MRLKDFTTAPEPNCTKSIEIEPGAGTKIFTLFLRMRGTVLLPCKVDQAWIYLIDRPVNEYGSEIKIEPLGVRNEHLVMVDCFGIYPIVVGGGENFQNALDTAQSTKPVLWTDQGCFEFDQIDIFVGSAQMTNFDAQSSMTLVRTAEFFENEEVMS